MPSCEPACDVHEMFVSLSQAQTIVWRTYAQACKSCGATSAEAEAVFAIAEEIAALVKAAANLLAQENRNFDA